MRSLTLGALAVSAALGISLGPRSRLLVERRAEPVNAAGKPLKRGNHCEKADKHRDPNKRHRRV